MASVTALCNSFKVELFEKIHDLSNGTTDVIRLALYTSTAAHTDTTTAYSATNEIAGGGTTGYVATGETTTFPAGSPTLSGTTAILDFGDVSWTSASFTAASTLLYNDTPVGNNSISVHDFGGDQTVTSGTFTIQMPAFDASNAILRIA